MFEGSLACVLSQLLGLALVGSGGRVWSLGAGTAGTAVWAVGVSLLLAFFETFTTQIDNLVLPLVAYILLKSPLPAAPQF